MRIRKQYWNNTSIANFIRGVPKPKAATSTQWNDWRLYAKRAKPVRFWLAENLLSKLQTFVMAPIDAYHSVKSYMTNKYVDKIHCLTAEEHHIKPGLYYDLDDRMICCLFGALVEFVEVDLANMHIALSAPGSYNRQITRSFLKRDRCSVAGIDALIAHIDSGDNSSADAQEVLDLYIWWTMSRGIDRLKLDGADESDYNMKQCEKKDSEMLHRLINVRHFLWV